VLAWNAAFEAAGLRNAIVVKDVDKDMTPGERARFDPSDITYNTVRWFTGQEAEFAEAPSRADPRTGRIFNAYIRVSDLMTRGNSDEEELAQPSAPGSGGEDDYGRQMARSAAEGLAMLGARGRLTAEEKQRYMAEYVTHIVAHETGHTLGLRHNFKGSAALPSALVGPGGPDGLLTASVMDYMPPNIALPGQRQGPFYQTKVGPYDFWAIEYGYKQLSPEEKANGGLAQVASRSGGDRALDYGTDEDAEQGLDPDAQLFTLGNSPVAYARHQTALALNLWKSLEASKAKPTQDYAAMRESFANGMAVYSQGVEALLPVIGGIRASRVRPGAARQPYEPVSAAEQREALDFLKDAVFSESPFRVTPELLRELGSDTLNSGPAGPYPLANEVLAIQDAALNHLFKPAVLKRLDQNELYAGKTADALGVGEALALTRDAIWSEIAGSKPRGITLLRRNLQREHVGALKATIANSAAPADAQAAARRDLRQLAGAIDRALRSKDLDAATRLHLEDMRAILGVPLQAGGEGVAANP
jgi:predicted Zn-dependent protease with MMP-like domain